MLHSLDCVLIIRIINLEGPSLPLGHGSHLYRKGPCQTETNTREVRLEATGRVRPCKSFSPVAFYMEEMVIQCGSTSNSNDLEDSRHNILQVQLTATPRPPSSKHSSQSFLLPSSYTYFPFCPFLPPYSFPHHTPISSLSLLSLLYNSDTPPPSTHMYLLLQCPNLPAGHRATRRFSTTRSLSPPPQTCLSRRETCLATGSGQLLSLPSTF